MHVLNLSNETVKSLKHQPAFIQPSKNNNTHREATNSDTPTINPKNK